MIRVVSLLLASSLAASSALACSCFAPTIESSFNNSDHAVVGQVTNRTIFPGWHVYDVRILRDLKDSQARGTIVRIATSDSQVTCGTSFNVGQRYVLFANDQQLAGQQRWTTTYCQASQPFANLDPDELDFLRTREMIDANGALVCGDPSVNIMPCLIDPCTTAPACPGGTCTANYCGGCNAEFYDAFGYETCTP